MQFKLSKKSTDRTLTMFHITDDKGTICGSVNVPNEAVSDLLKCWRGTAAPAAAGAQHQSAVAALSAALRKGPRLNKEAILRGC